MEDAIMGEGDEAGGAGPGAGFEDWPDDDEVEAAPHRQPASGPQGADPSGGPAAQGGVLKRRAALAPFGGQPKRPKVSAAATKRDEAAAKAARFRKVVKQPRAVSA